MRRRGVGVWVILWTTLASATPAWGQSQPDRASDRLDEEAAAAAATAAASSRTSSPPSTAEPRPAAATPKSAAAKQTTNEAATNSGPSAGPKSFEEQLEQLARHIDALKRHALEPGVDATTLFDVELSDEHAVAIEAARLRALLSKDESDAGIRAILDRARAAVRGDAGAESQDSSHGSWSRSELAARLRLDRARLRFYSLSPATRAAALEAHAAQQLEAPSGVVEEKADAAEMRAKEAERQQQEALQAALNARTEALRLLSEEQARLLGISAEQANFEARLLARRAQMLERQEELLSWQRQVRELLERARRHDASPEVVNDFYTRLRADLRENRDQLSNALVQIRQPPDVPQPGRDRLSNLPPDVDAAVPRAKRAEVLAEAERLVAAERQLDYERAQIFYQSMVALNADRLALYPFLSESLRSAIVGFGPYGLDQAQAELRQVMLTIRYSMVELRQWLKDVTTRGVRGQSALAVSVVALKWLVPIGAFVWWRRRADPWLKMWREAARRERRDSRSVTHSGLERFVEFIQRIHRPLESLLLTITVVWLLPHEALMRLEVQLLATVFRWTFGGALVVAVIDALAERRQIGAATATQLDGSQVRLRSLRLLGRVVVVIALILSLSADLVGKGTVYAWVLSTSWFAAIPVLLVIAHWWKAIVYQRLHARRRKPPIVEWALQQRGYRSLFVSLSGGAFLMYEGVVRTIKPILADFDLSRRVLAYLFRRDLSKRADVTARQPHAPLPAKLYTQLGPSTPSDVIVPSVADAQVSLVIDRINQPGGGVFALVGERGSGKSTILRRIASEGEDAHLVKCPLNADEIQKRLLRTSDAPDGISLEEAAKLMDQDGRHTALLIDDAHRLVKPVMGGLRAFDEFVEMASRHSLHCAWVFAFDEVMWTFLERARGAKPLFDEVIELKPWGDEAIATLLETRCAQTDVSPKFDGLVGPLPRDADEVDMQDALARTVTGYHRLIWDYASGNPGIALHTWRRCLAQSVDSGEIVVSNFEAPDTRELEMLPDEPSFVLRAIVQLEFARADEIVGATRLHRAVVDSALRFAMVRNYLELRGDRYWITWAWYRPITRFLERKHLLARN